MDKESIAGIRFGLRDSRRSGLTQFVMEFMKVLVSEGFTFEDLLCSLADYAHTQRESETAIHHLEQASMNVDRKLEN